MRTCTSRLPFLATHNLMRPLVNLALLVHLARSAGSPLDRAPQVLDEHLQPPQQDFHFLSTDTAFTNESCTLSIAAQSERTDFSKWGKGDRWPALHLIITPSIGPRSYYLFLVFLRKC